MCKSVLGHAMQYDVRRGSVQPIHARIVIRPRTQARSLRGALVPIAGLHQQQNMSAQNNRKRTRAGSPSAVAEGRGAGVDRSPSDSQIRVPGLVVINHTFTGIPLDWNDETLGHITLFAREIHSPVHPKKSQPFLLYLQGGPGFESPRPTDAHGWIKSAVNHFRVILLDQRGTGRSSPITVRNLQKNRTPEQQAQYLTFFRADNIVRDAEFIRNQLVPKDNCGGRWSILGQSFGGFCAFTYMSIAPQGLLEVMMTGGIPPGVDKPCAADHVYRALYKRVIQANVRYYTRFPDDVQLVHHIVQFLSSQPEGGLQLPSGTLLTPRLLQTLGLAGLGSGGGFERLHFLLESFFDSEGDVTLTFCKAFEAWHSWDTNPLYALVHESIYCQGAASNWSAQRIRDQEYSEVFDAAAAVKKGRGQEYSEVFDAAAAVKK